MTTSEGLLRRWSRRKQAARAVPPAPADPAEAAAAVSPEPSDLSAPDPPSPNLPSIETLGTSSDYTAFLKEGVAAEVQRLALQRAWQSDERIAGFRGMAEYAWDFNAPDYGRLSATDDVAKLLKAVLTPPEDPPEVVAELAAPAEPREAASAKPVRPPEPGQAGDAPDAPPGPVADAAPVQKDASPRRHGSALPS